MAWDDIDRNGIEGVSGDKPIDELALALTKIASAYKDRFARKPTLHELLYALEVVISANPDGYVSDGAGLALGAITVGRTGEQLNLDGYTAYYTDSTPPGHHVITKQTPEEHEVLRILVLETQGRVLVCEYEVLVGAISDKMIELLLVETLLNEYYDASYKEDADRITFVEHSTKHSWTVPYV